MAVKGLDIFKLSPKKNCKECGSPTCMAFCMKVASGALEITKCPYMSEEAIALLTEAAAPPMKTLELGGFRLGGETVMFRHEKALNSPNRYAACISSALEGDALEAALTDLTFVDYERIGEREFVEYAYVIDAGTGAARVADIVSRVKAAGRASIVETKDIEVVNAVLAVTTDVIINGADESNWEAMNAAVKGRAILGLQAPDAAAFFELASKLEKAGNHELVFDVTGSGAKKAFENAITVRRGALVEGQRTLGYPSIVNLAAISGGDPYLETAYAAAFTLKYGSILVVDRMTYAASLALHGLRQNIFTDPQKPMSVEPGIYPLNGAGPDDSCMITVDFALTYFLVAGEVERSKVPVNLLVSDASGMSVLTAWAAGKFSSGTVRRFFEEHEIDKKINSRTLIIPGKVAVMKNEIQEKLPDWNVVAGTKEAVEIARYLKSGEHIEAAKAAEKSKASLKKDVEIATGVTGGNGLVYPEIRHIDTGVHYTQRDPESKKFVVIGERIHCISPVIREAMSKFDPEPIIKRAADQIRAGATYLDVNIGPAESNGPELMTWAVRTLQENFDNVPLALDTANRAAIEAGIRVYNRTNGKPIVNSADAGSRISYIDLAAANDAIVIALCSADGLAKDCEERMMHCHTMLERGLSLGMDASDLWFDPAFLVVKGMQDKQMEILETIRLFSQEGLKSTGGLSNNSNGAPKAVRPVMDSTLVAMAMMQGLTSAIINPNDRRTMETIRTADLFRNNELYSDSYLDSLNS